MEVIGFLICLLSGILCFWLFYKCIDWFDIMLKRRFYVHSIVYCGSCDVHLYDVCPHQAREILRTE